MSTTTAPPDAGPASESPPSDASLKKGTVELPETTSQPAAKPTETTPQAPADDHMNQPPTVSSTQSRRDSAVVTGPPTDVDYITRVVVIALDSSSSSGPENSDVAFHWALDNFLDPHRDLAVLVNVRAAPVVPGPFGTAYMDFSDYIVQLEEKFRIEAHRLLQRYAALVKKRGVAVKAIAMRGDPRDELTRKVNELNADALVIGCRGLGAIRRALMGSVSDYLIHHVKCPVVIIKDNTSETPPPTTSSSTLTLPSSNVR
ncbi:hypothetical protein HK104_004208 [Borealophlyctis nickersoniae]|nr:hypothetical protein HK104_004208 [Borealophlyctis nickersoniae]